LDPRDKQAKYVDIVPVHDPFVEFPRLQQISNPIPQQSLREQFRQPLVSRAGPSSPKSERESASDSSDDQPHSKVGGSENSPKSSSSVSGLQPSKFKLFSSGLGDENPIQDLDYNRYPLDVELKLNRKDSDTSQKIKTKHEVATIGIKTKHEMAKADYDKDYADYDKD
jgi:hypothetical protein